jgi:hypothetical protein
MLLPKITGTMIRAGRVFVHLSQDPLAATGIQSRQRNPVAAAQPTDDWAYSIGGDTFTNDEDCRPFHTVRCTRWRDIDFGHAAASRSIQSWSAR